MEKELHKEYLETNLQQFVSKLRENCYHEIENLCGNARKQIGSLTQIGAKQSPLQYITTCNDIIAEIDLYITSRKEKFIPYLQKLSEKVGANHDCSNCSGGCKLDHDLHFLELKASNAGIKNILSRLQTIVLPLYSDTAFPDGYRILRNQMALIENSLTELFFLEENYLLPKVMEAQKSINASHA